MEKPLYIPMGVKSTPEFFNGFGRRELGQSMIGIVAFGCVALLIHFVTHSSFATLVTMFIGIMGSFFATTKGGNNLNAIDEARLLVSYFQSQKQYRYRMGKEW